MQSPRRGFSAVPFFGDLVVFTRLIRDKEAHWGLKVLALATLAYVISPIDALPEAVMPMIAWIDDVGLVFAVRAAIDSKLAKYRYPLFEKPPAAVLSATNGWPATASPYAGDGSK
ncbi:MAG TPA: DUF1232 domain-containing protein [Polyangiaceae bacterium]|jgi:uncharacterized membrane protein YkvA (DUF1232 family)|nr:DUF1232 domain-containing protein [Polyangiaceae bacterium]